MAINPGFSSSSYCRRSSLFRYKDLNLREKTLPFILCWESKLFSHHAIRRLFRYAGLRSHHYIITASRHDFLELAVCQPSINLLFISLGTDKEAGYALLNYLRAFDHMKSVWAVAVSEHIGSGEVRRAQREGFNSFLPAPLDPRCFPDQLKAMLQRQAVWQA